MDNMNTNAREHGKTQAMMYLEQKRKANATDNNSDSRENKSDMMSLPVHKLKVVYTAQRALTKSVENIVKNFNSNLFMPIVVSERDGIYYVIDGQHRLFAARKLFGEDYLMECKVIHGLSQMEESNLFVKLNSSSKPLQYADKAKGLYYGNDEVTVNIYNICKNHGVELGIEDDKRASMDGRITAVKALTDTYNKIGAKQTDRLVKLLNDTWDGKSTAFKQEMIKAVGVILSLYGRELDDNKFIKKLGKVNPAELIRMAKSDRVTNAKTEAKIARIMVNNYYNKGKGANPLEYRFGF